MASTNKTTNYELSQYIGTDKPTYLTDYNQDMNKIDTGIHAAKTTADSNASAIGTLSNLTTTAKTDLVSAINEVDSDLSSLSSDVGDNTSDIGALQGDVGNKSNLNTTDKSNLVSAINEVNSKGGSLSNLNTTEKNNLVGAINEVDNNVKNFNLTNYETISSTSDVTSANGSVITSVDLGIAKNNDGSLAKIYGQLICKCRGNDTLTFQTSLRPETDININGHVTRMIFGGAQYGINVYNLAYVTMTIHTDGRVTVPCTYVYNAGVDEAIYLFTNSLLYIKDFGDYIVPRPINN